MKTCKKNIKLWVALCTMCVLFWIASKAEAKIDGLEVGINGVNETFIIDFTTKTGFISTAEGNSVNIYGYTLTAVHQNDLATDITGNFPFISGTPQYPGPTLIVEQGDTIQIRLFNQLDVPVSLVFPGQEVAAAGGNAGLLTQEAPANNAAPVEYTFTPHEPGTYYYHSGTYPAVEVSMGLVGALIVRPFGFDPNNPRAYNHPGSAYDQEYLFMESEMDSLINQQVALFGIGALESQAYLSNYFPNYWFLNGRTFPDTMADSYFNYLPTQPYSCLPQMHPGEKLLMRIVNVGREMHPFHHHGNHARTIAIQGRLLLDNPSMGLPDRSFKVFSAKSYPGETRDAVFEWTGKGLGWDIYGHAVSDPLEPNEDPDDHGRPIPVILPESLDLTYGGLWSGSPYLGALGSLPPGEGGLNPSGAYTYMWHSHSEKELTNYDIFPGGLATFLFIQPNGTPIE